MFNISLKEQFEEVLADICHDNDLRYYIFNEYCDNSMTTKYEFYNSHYTVDNCLTCEWEFGVLRPKYVLDDFEEESKNIVIAWDNIDCTLFELLRSIQTYMDHYLTKKNYDWSFIMKYFTKKDLKNGDVIEQRNGSLGIVIPDKDVVIYQNGYNRLSDWKDDLTFDDITDSPDIMKVYRPTKPVHCTLYNTENGHGDLVFERKEVEEMTLEEVCKALGKEIKIVKEK